MAVPVEKYFPATVMSLVHRVAPLIKEKLTDDQMKIFRSTIFGPLLDVDICFNGQLIHHFLLRMVSDNNPDVISFDILGKRVTFSQKEFNLITGCWPSMGSTDQCEASGERLRLILGRPSGDDTCKDVEDAFVKCNFTNDEDAVKVALALFIETYMIGKDKKTKFDAKTFGIVDDLEFFRRYDWSSVLYKRLINCLKHITEGKLETHHIKSRENKGHTTYYCVKGFVIAFQVQYILRMYFSNLSINLYVC